jgi:uncharacterized cupin superfamily protein
MPADPPPPRPPFRIEDVPWTEFSHGERFQIRYRALGDFGGCKRIGTAIEELPPGKQSSPFHFHMLEEEHLWILEGRATLRLGEERHQVSAGDYVVFPAGRKVGHCLVNDSDAVCRYLIIGERNPNEVAVYPDSGKVRVRWLDQNFRRAPVDIGTARIQTTEDRGRRTDERAPLSAVLGRPPFGRVPPCAVRCRPSSVSNLPLRRALSPFPLLHRSG